MKTKFYLMIILSMAAISGCYTVLQHPEVPNQDEMGNVYHQNINTSDNCYSCHTEKTDQIYDYDRYMNYYSNSGVADEYNVNNRWDSYYSVPWWFIPPKVSVGVGTSTSSGSGSTTNKTTSGSTSTTRSAGSTRSDVKISAPAATRGTSSSSSTSSSSTEKKNDSTTSANRSNNSNDNNQGTSSSRSSSNTNDDKRNTGSTRGK
jgi:hypothetical protein